MKYTTLTPEISAALECAKAQYLAAKPENKGQYSYRANPKQLQELFAAMKLAGSLPNDCNNAALDNGLLRFTVIGPSSSKERYARIYFDMSYLRGYVTGLGATGTMPDSPLTTFSESVDIMLTLAEFDTEAVKRMKMEKVTAAAEVMQRRAAQWQELLYNYSEAEPA